MKWHKVNIMSYPLYNPITAMPNIENWNYFSYHFLCRSRETSHSSLWSLLADLVVIISIFQYFSVFSRNHIRPDGFLALRIAKLISNDFFFSGPGRTKEGQFLLKRLWFQIVFNAEIRIIFTKMLLIPIIIFIQFDIISFDTCLSFFFLNILFSKSLTTKKL